MPERRRSTIIRIIVGVAAPLSSRVRLALPPPGTSITHQADDLDRGSSEEESHQAIMISPSRRHTTAAVFRRRPSHQLFGTLAALLVAAAGVGCSQSTTPKTPDGPAADDASALPSTAPATLLRMTFLRYRNSDYYSDRGFAELTYQGGQGTERRTAPLATWYDRGRLYVSAYETRLWRDNRQSIAWFVGDAAKLWQQQVLIQDVRQRRPDLEHLLSDPALVTAISAGRAGPPPQLEWMFAENPMQKLFDDDAQFVYGDIATIDQVPCRSVNVTSGNERFTFWIDTTQTLIRRVDLPSLLIPADQTTSDQPIEPSQPPANVAAVVQLSIHLRDATRSQRTGPPPMESFPSAPVTVAGLVPPPTVSPGWLGQRVSGDRIQLSRRPATNRGDQDQIVHQPWACLLSLSDSPLAGYQLDLLRQWVSRMPADLRRKVLIGAVLPAGDSSDDRIVGDESMLDLVYQQAPSQDPTWLLPGSLTVLDHQGRIQWHEPNFVAATLPQTGAVLADLVNGVNVPQRIRQQHRRADEDFRRRLEKQHSAAAELILPSHAP